MRCRLIPLAAALATAPLGAHRIVTEGISPEQAVDDGIARIKQILSE